MEDLVRPTLHCGEGPMIIKMLRALKTHPKAIQWNFNYIICWWFGPPSVRYHKYSKWNKKDIKKFHVKLCEFENLNLFSTFSKKINHALLSLLFMNFAPTDIKKKIALRIHNFWGPSFFTYIQRLFNLFLQNFPHPFRLFGNLISFSPTINRLFLIQL
jgi:hypothetical protein